MPNFLQRVFPFHRQSQSFISLFIVLTIFFYASLFGLVLAILFHLAPYGTLGSCGFWFFTERGILSAPPFSVFARWCSSPAFVFDFVR